MPGRFKGPGNVPGPFGLFLSDSGEFRDKRINQPSSAGLTFLSRLLGVTDLPAGRQVFLQYVSLI
jgi:hypothetical protein